MLPLQFKNTNDTPLELHITAITFSYKSVISQFIPDAQKLILHPEKDDVHTIILAVPEQFRNEGRYTADIRIDGEVNGNYRFSHAESVKLTITASWFRQTVRKITGIPKSLVKAAGFGIITFVLLLIAGRLVIRYRASLRNSAGRKLVYSSKGQKLSANSREFRYPVISRTDSAQQPFIISEIIELFVINQNTAIGKRNIHLLKAGSVMTIGGAKRDDFLIFLVPFPPALAEIHYTGTQYTLVINKPEFFPYEQEPVIQNCIGKIITIISDKGYPVSFMFRGYQDPTAQLNALLTSIQKKR